jgi:hypothetical protein
MQPYVAPKRCTLTVQMGKSVRLPICAQQAVQLGRRQRHEPVNVSLHHRHVQAVHKEVAKEDQCFRCVCIRYVVLLLP